MECRLCTILVVDTIIIQSRPTVNNPQPRTSRLPTRAANWEMKAVEVYAIIGTASQDGGSGCN